MVQVRRPDFKRIHPSCTHLVTEPLWGWYDLISFRAVKIELGVSEW